MFSVSVNNDLCVVNHIFFTCPKIQELWKLWCKWFNFSTVMPEEANMHFHQEAGLFVNNTHGATAWYTWNARNNCMFRNQAFHAHLRLGEGLPKLREGSNF